MKKVLTVSGVFISGLIGAGFATGSEIYFYFIKYGKIGLLGIILSSVLFSALLYAVVYSSSKLNAHTIDEYLNKIMPKPMAMVISFFSKIFMLFILAAMLSGCGEMLYMLYGIKKSIGALFMLVITFAVITKGHNGFIMSESILFAVITTMIILVCVYIIFFCECREDVFAYSNVAWAGSAFSYAGYNMLTAVAVLCIVSDNTTQRNAKMSATFTFIMLFAIMSLIGYVINMHKGLVRFGAMPLIDICKFHSVQLAGVYSVAVFVSMLTTAISVGYSLVSGLKMRIGDKRIIPCSIFVFAYFLSGMDFSFVVDKLYRAAGIFGIIMSIYIFRYIFIKNNILRKLKISKENKRI